MSAKGADCTGVLLTSNKLRLRVKNLSPLLCCSSYDDKREFVKELGASRQVQATMSRGAQYLCAINNI